MLSKQEVKHIAKLARLGLTEKEAEKYRQELSKILDYIEKLKEADVADAESMSRPAAEPRESEARRGKRTKFSATLLENVMRSDKSQKPKGETLKLLELAPETKNGYLKVKSILKQS